MIHKFYKEKYYTEMPESQKAKMVFSYNQLIEFAEEYSKLYHKAEVLKLNKANVSGNEANQSENKKVGEVAVCEHYFVDEIINDIYYLKCKRCGKIKNHKQTDR